MNEELYKIVVSDGEPEWSEEYFNMIDWDKEE